MISEIPNTPELKELSDREVLILVTERLRVVCINQTNHLKHHWAITIMCLAAGVAGLINIGIALFIILLNGQN